VQQRVGVKGDDQLGAHGRQPGIEGVALAGSWLGDTAHLLAGGGPVGLGNSARSVDRAVVDDEDLDGARIVLAGDVGNRLLDPVGLVAGGDQPAREVGDQRDDQDRRDDRDCRGKLTNPWQ
jgi:hypothetical protein